MAFQVTTATKKLLKLDKRIRAVAGGTSAGKTIAILQILINYAQSVDNQLISVVSESFPHLRRGAMRDFINILQSAAEGDTSYWDYYGEDAWSKSEFTYSFPNGSKIEFFSADQPGKVRGPRRDVLFVNEANNVPKEAWDQLVLRTRKFAFADWNPVANFYMYDDYALHDENDVPYADDEDTDFTILTYKDNEALEDSIIKDIRKRASLNKAWGRVYAEGLRGELDEKIFKGWQIVPDIPHEAHLEVAGMDFGYAQDPTVLVDIYYYNGGYILDEQIYRVGLRDSEAASQILNGPNPNKLIIGDSADKQKVDMLYDMGLNIVGVEKKGVGGDKFTNAAIGFVQNQRVSVTKRSTKVIRDYRDFMWQTDKDGNIVPKYDHFHSDGMMAVVYGMTNFDSRRREAIFTPPKHQKRFDSITGRVLT
jgi:phage terminase large subunit